MRRLFLGILLVSLVFISGCVDNGFLPVGGKYCKAIGLCNVEEKEVEIPDVIVIKEVDIPLLKGGEITPNREVDILVTLKNRDVDNIIELEYVGINPGIFSCKQRGCISEEEAKGSIGTINPGQEKTFSFKVSSPDNKGTMALEGHLEVSVKYKYTSTRLATITYINKNTYIEYLESGGKIPLDIINVPSEGPVELYLDISKIKQPIIIEEDSGTTPEGKYQIYLKVMNKGSGEIDKISAGSLTIEFEDMKLGTCSEEFDGEGCGGSSSVSNTEDITIRGKKPFRYYFSFDPSSLIENDLSEDKLTTTKKISAEAGYIYRISKKIDILVSPRAEY